MVEQIVDAKIRLVFARGMNFCNFDGSKTACISGNGAMKGYVRYTEQKNFTVHIATPPEKHIQQYTALLHELGHILYESPFTPMKQLLEKWDKCKTDYWRKLKNPNRRKKILGQCGDFDGFAKRVDNLLNTII